MVRDPQNLTQSFLINFDLLLDLLKLKLCDVRAISPGNIIQLSQSPSFIPYSEFVLYLTVAIDNMTLYGLVFINI